MSKRMCEKIARDGEPIYASIIRNRSGIDAGDIDYCIRVSEISKLSKRDRQMIVNVAYEMYESICNATGTEATE